MNYLTERSGKVINTTSEILHFYNLLKEEVKNYFHTTYECYIYWIFWKNMTSWNFFQKNQNLTLPKWTEAVYPALLKEMVALHFKLRSYTRTLKRLNGGIRILISHFFLKLIFYIWKSVYSFFLFRFFNT